MISSLKSVARSRLPFLVPLWGKARHAGYLARCLMRSRQERFASIYRDNTWGDNDSVSGTGSNLHETEAVRDALPKLLAELGCRSLLDAPCGDFYWMKLVPLAADYTGADIVPDLVRRNQEKYGASNRRFVHLDLAKDPLPKVDLVLCRDCLVHLSYADIRRVLANLKQSGSKYLLTTTFPQKRNTDIITGSWRPLNLEQAPFALPPPIRLLNERCPQAEFADKSLGLWRISELPDLR